MANEQNEPDAVAGDGPGAGYVKLPGIIVLAVYLVVLTLVLTWQLRALWPSCDSATTNPSATASAAPTETPGPKPEESPGGTPGQPTPPVAGSTPTTSATPGSPASDHASGVKVISVSPSSGDLAGGTPVKINGLGFLAKPTVTFGAAPATDVQMESATSISARTPTNAAGPVAVAVKNTDGKSDTLPSGFTYEVCGLAQCRSRLPLLVLLAGALGACFHALRSLWMFVGNRDLKQSWVLMYIALPVNGAVLAFIFFIVISAGTGFFAQPQGSNSCYWIIGIAALVGLFSQQAAETLKKIAEAVFTVAPKKADSLSGGAPSVSVTSIVPATGPLAGKTSVTITGKGLTKNSVVTFGDAAGANVQLVSPTSISVETPPGKQAGPVDVVVTEPTSTPKDVKAGVFTYQ